VVLDGHPDAGAVDRIQVELLRRQRDLDASELSTDTAGGAASTMITCWGSAWPERPSPIMTSHERSA